MRVLVNETTYGVFMGLSDGRPALMLWHVAPKESAPHSLVPFSLARRHEPRSCPCAEPTFARRSKHHVHGRKQKLNGWTREVPCAVCKSCSMALVDTLLLLLCEWTVFRRVQWSCRVWVRGGQGTHKVDVWRMFTRKRTGMFWIHTYYLSFICSLVRLFDTSIQRNKKNNHHDFCFLDRLP